MKHTTFSIIIPIYNSTPFLRECINSVTMQNYAEWELLLVNDGSTDDSLKVCFEYEQMDKRICVLSIPHSGAGAARNAGIRKASGDFIVFLDADDYWRDVDLLKKIDFQIRNRHADVVMFQMIQVTADGHLMLNTRKPHFPNYRNSYLIKEVFPVLVRDGQVLASACNKCVRRQLLKEHEIEFLEGITAEDIDWVLHVFSCVKVIAFLDGEAYAYRQHAIGNRASEHSDGANYLAFVIRRWADRLFQEDNPLDTAIAGMVAYEFGIYMGYSHQVPRDERRLMKNYRYLLQYGLDRKTKMIYRFYGRFGFTLTCLAVRIYLLGRKFRR